MNKAYRFLDGIRWPGSYLCKPISTLIWHQIGSFDRDISRVPCARILCCAVRLEGEDCSIIDPFSSIDSREVFLGFSIGLYSTTRRIHCKISPRWAPEWSFKFWSKLVISPWILLYPRPLTDSFRYCPSIMHDMDMNEAYGCLDGIRGPGSCLSRPTSTPIWHQIGSFDCGK